MIRFRSVTYTYPGAASPALNDVDLEIEEGTFLVVAGASGSGKSTLARAIGGLVPHFHGGTFAGAVTVDGRDIRQHPPHALAGIVASVDQRPEAQSVADLVEDEICFGMENLGVDPTTMRKRLEEVLDQVGVEHLRARRIGTLSGGERQRVQIAAALALLPKVLVLDEPTSQLDPGAAEDVFAFLQRLHSDLGLTLVVVEHRLERVVQHADRLVVLRDGRIHADGRPEQVLADGAAATPLSRLARGLGWDRVPLTVRDGRARARAVTLHPPAERQHQPGATLLEMRDVRVALAGSEVLRGVELTARAGEVVAIAGRNGAGKTTLLRSVLGLTKAHSGRVRLAGREVRRVDDAVPHAAYVPQDAATIVFGRTVREEAPDADLAAHGLAHLGDTDPRDLSAGLRLRVALAGATAGAPALIALDEPTRGVDHEGKALLAELIDAWRSAGRLVLLVTHDVELIAACATRVLVLSDGEVVVDGPVREVLGGSPLFSSQMHKVFGDRRIATVEDVLEAVR